MAAIRREGEQLMEWQQYGNTEGGWTIDGMAAIWREDEQQMEWQQYGGRVNN